LQVGNSFYKNVEGCLRVVKLLRDRGLTVTFLRGGRRLTHAQQMLAERLGVLDLVRELGPLRDEELPMLYNSADVLLAPSLYEGFGWPPLEAMACAVPVVCSRAGSLGDVAAPAALTADPEDIDTLADHVAAVLTDQALADGLRRSGLAWVERFNWTNTAKQMLAVYQRVQHAAGN
jgi:glycosyltransferase involved in cell wall biosynthesis